MKKATVVGKAARNGWFQEVRFDGPSGMSMCMVAIEKMRPLNALELMAETL